MRALRLKIVEKHAGCSAAEEARAAASGPATRPPTDALSALMAASKKRQAATREEAAIQAATERRDAARQQLADAECELAALTAAASGSHSAAAESQLPAVKRQKQLELERWQAEAGHWTPLQWSDYEASVQTRRSVEIKDLATEPLAPHRGVDGFLQHWRRGLVGAVQSWARGCKAHVVLMTLSDRSETRTPSLLSTRQAPAAVPPIWYHSEGWQRSNPSIYVQKSPLPDDTLFKIPARVYEEIRGGCWLGVGAGRRAAS